MLYKVRARRATTTLQQLMCVLPPGFGSLLSASGSSA